MKLPKFVLRNVNSENLGNSPSGLGRILRLDFTDAEGLGLSKVSCEVQSCTGIVLQKRNRGVIFVLESEVITDTCFTGLEHWVLWLTYKLL